MSKAYARATDPQTSHEAAQSVKRIGETHRLILQVLQTAMTDTELVHQIHQNYGLVASESGIRSRRAELVAQGYVEDTGARVKLASGRNSIVWVRS